MLPNSFNAPHNPITTARNPTNFCQQYAVAPTTAATAIGMPNVITFSNINIAPDNKFVPSVAAAVIIVAVFVATQYTPHDTVATPIPMANAFMTS